MNITDHGMLIQWRIRLLKTTSHHYGFGLLWIYDMQKKLLTVFVFQELIFIITNTLLKDSCDVEAQLFIFVLKKTICYIIL